MPRRDLTDREQKQLLYRRKMQFCTGDLASELQAASSSKKLGEKKGKLSQALKDIQGKTSEGALQQLMHQHFKESKDHDKFFSLPLDIVRTLPVKQMSVALTSLLQVKGRAAQPSGMLPLGDASHCLPLAERAAIGAITDKDAPFAIEDDSWGADLALANPPNFSDQELDLEQLLQFCQNEGVLMFRISDKNPHLKKRPLHSVDNMVSSDIAIRLYKCHQLVNAETAWVTSITTTEVPLLQIFQGKDPHAIIQHMWSWRLDEGFDESTGAFKLVRATRVFTQRPGCPLTLARIDVNRNLKPTSFELYLALVENGWTLKTWSGKQTDLKRLAINLDPRRGTKIFYSTHFYYMLCLVTLPSISFHLSNPSCLAHGQIEAYYAAAFHFAGEMQYEQLVNLQPDKPATFYRTPGLSWSLICFMFSDSFC